jgi:hypothetical protein
MYNTTVTGLEYSLLAIVQISVFRKTVRIQRTPIPMFQWKILKLNYSLACDLCTVCNVTVICNEHSTFKISAWVNNVLEQYTCMSAAQKYWMWTILVDMKCLSYLLIKNHNIFPQLSRSTVSPKVCVLFPFSVNQPSVTYYYYYICLLQLGRHPVAVETPGGSSNFRQYFVPYSGVQTCTQA